MSILFSHPIKKLTLLTAFAGGYVLGAKAGRERYEQIRQVAGQVKDDPRVKEAAARAEDLAREAATKIADTPQVKDAAHKVEDLARDAANKVTEKPQVKEAAVKAKKAADAAKPKPKPKQTANNGETMVHGVNPLLADEHVATEDEVVYSAGPDIEETVDELAPSTDAERL